jgi:uncharacterized protein (DUF1330 family)
MNTTNPPMTATQLDIATFETFMAYRGRTADAMRRHGGGFVSGLAGALTRADGNNARKIYDTWPEIIRDFGPGSRFFNATPQ